MNIEIMLHNPLAFHDHDKFNEAIENQLDLITESKDRKDALIMVQNYLNEEGYFAWGEPDRL